METKAFWEVGGFVVGVLGFVVGMVALIVGMVHLASLHTQARGLRDQAKLSEEHSRSLRIITDTILTRHIGQFPAYIAEIAGIIAGATREIEVLCDFPGYGSYSAPHDFLKYRQAIERKIDEGVSVKITCLNSAGRFALIPEQFAKEVQEWDDYKKRKHDRLLTLLKPPSGAVTLDALTASKFFALLEEEDSIVLDKFFKGAQLSEIDEFIPLYFWLVDGETAVFAIPGFSERGIEHGYTTRDRHLIEGFQEIRSRYQRASEQGALTTRFIGPFPEYIPQIVSLIEGAEELVVFCDIPAYGCFTSHDQHVKYRQAIERKILDNKLVELTFLDQKWREKALREQVHFEGDRWDKLKVDKKPQLEKFLEHYGNGCSLDQLTPEVFLDLLEQLSLRVLHDECLGKGKEVNTAMPVLFWLADNKKAVFAIPNYEPDIPTLGFSTSDQSLIVALKEMSKRYRQLYCET